MNNVYLYRCSAARAQFQCMVMAPQSCLLPARRVPKASVAVPVAGWPTCTAPLFPPPLRYGERYATPCNEGMPAPVPALACGYTETLSMSGSCRDCAQVSIVLPPSVVKRKWPEERSHDRGSACTAEICEPTNAETWTVRVLNQSSQATIMTMQCDSQSHRTFCAQKHVRAGRQSATTYHFVGEAAALRPNQRPVSHEDLSALYGNVQYTRARAHTHTHTHTPRRN